MQLPGRWAPDVVAEVVSPTDRAGAVADRRCGGSRGRPPGLGRVYPDRLLAAEHFPDGTVHLRLGGDVRPGFRLPVDDLFA